jgi:hypothetical protein
MGFLIFHLSIKNVMKFNMNNVKDMKYKEANVSLQLYNVEVLAPVKAYRPIDSRKYIIVAKNLDVCKTYVGNKANDVRMFYKSRIRE